LLIVLLTETMRYVCRPLPIVHKHVQSSSIQGYIETRLIVYPF